MYKILFVCSANKSRSPSLEAYVKHLAKKNKIKNIKVNSAGTYEQLIRSFLKTGKTKANPIIRRMLSKEGIHEINRHRTKSISRKLVEGSSLILTASQKNKDTVLENFPRVRGKVFTIKEYVGMKGDIVDAHYHPNGNIMYDKTTKKNTAEAYRKMLKEIRILAEMTYEKLPTNMS